MQIQTLVHPTPQSVASPLEEKTALQPSRASLPPPQKALLQHQHALQQPQHRPKAALLALAANQHQHMLRQLLAVKTLLLFKAFHQLLSTPVGLGQWALALQSA